MAKVYYDRDADLALLQGKTIAILGYGNQGRAHALNLRDSGLKVIVGNIEDASAAQGRTDGFEVMGMAEASARADVIMVLVPDQVQREVYYRDIAPGMAAGKTLMFAHGFNIHFNQIQPPSDVDVSMVAPKGPGALVRTVYEGGGGVPALIAVQQNATELAKQTALAYARGIGATRAGVLETTFEEETETDLFGEQSVLCGGVTALVQAGFETLVEAGYQPEIAYFECMHELKLIVDLMYEGGMAKMRRSISDTAEFGDYTRGPRVIDDCAKEAMREILEEIQTGEFAREWILENQAGRPRFLALRRRAAEHPIEQVGGELRGMMSWLSQAKK